MSTYIGTGATTNTDTSSDTELTLCTRTHVFAPYQKEKDVALVALTREDMDDWVEKITQ